LSLYRTFSYNITHYRTLYLLSLTFGNSLNGLVLLLYAAEGMGGDSDWPGTRRSGVNGHAPSVNRPLLAARKGLAK
jgi:hypothetical protein